MTQTFELDVPKPHADRLSFCSHSPKRFKEWVEALPLVNLGETSKQLYLALQELNALIVDRATRFQLLEIVRPAVYYVCEALSKHYLNQPIILPEPASKVANLAQALQTYSAVGYKLIVIDTVQHLKNQDAKDLLAQSLHRALSDLCGALLRCHQLYLPAAKGLWLELHALFLIAEQCRLLRYTADDPQTCGAIELDIESVYKRALLLGTSKLNQLRQSEMATVYDLSSLWGQYLAISRQPQPGCLFAINLQGSHEPINMALVAANATHDHFRYLHCGVLIKQIRKTMAIETTNEPTVAEETLLPTGVSAEMFNKLLLAWSVPAQRSFSRISAAGSLLVTIGFSPTHYHVAGKKEFEESLLPLQKSETPQFVDDQNPFLYRKSAYTGKPYERRPGEDVWAHSFDAAKGAENPIVLSKTAINFKQVKKTTDTDSDVQEQKVLYKPTVCQLVNTSPGGYCVLLPMGASTQIKTGEVVGVCEDDQADWNIGVIRWVKRFSQEGARMGIELLAPSAEAVGVKHAGQKSDASTSAFRALLLPELRTIQQPATLITPSISFRAGLKVSLNQKGEENKVKLTRQLVKTASFCQFEFQFTKLKVLPSDASDAVSEDAPDDKKSDFDSIWSSL